MAHSYYLGRSGTGKSTLLIHHTIEAINANEGVFFVDPNGDAIDTILGYIPPHRRNETILFDPTGHLVPYNPLDTTNDHNQVSDALLYAFRDIWLFGDASTPTFDEYVLHTILSLLQFPQPSLVMVPLLLQSERFRDRVLEKIDEPHLNLFWQNFEKMTNKEKRDEIRSTKNKMNAIVSDLRLRRVLGSKTAFSMDQVLDNKILLLRLPQGKLGINKTRLLGMLMISQLHLAMCNRNTDNPFHIFVDEAHHFQGFSLMELLSGSRKFGIDLHVSHQYLKQLTTPMRDALLGNTDNKYIFRISRADSELVDEIDGPNQINSAYYDLPRYTWRDGKTQKQTEPLPDPPYNPEKTIEASRRKFSRSIKLIDAELDPILKMA